MKLSVGIPTHTFCFCMFAPENASNKAKTIIVYHASMRINFDVRLPSQPLEHAQIHNRDPGENQPGT